MPVSSAWGGGGAGLRSFVPMNATPTAAISTVTAISTVSTLSTVSTTGPASSEGMVANPRRTRI